MLLVLVIALSMLFACEAKTDAEERAELRHAMRELEKAKAELEELGLFKSRLLALASHQIKSPLAAIKGFIEIISEGLYGPIGGSVQEALHKTKRATDDLLTLLNNVLDLRKVEEGRMDYHFEKTDIVSLARSVADLFEELAAEKKLKFDFAASEPAIFVNADGGKLRQIFQNFIDNAIKYTPSGYVRVEVTEPAHGEVMFSVSDS